LPGFFTGRRGRRHWTSWGFAACGGSSKWDRTATISLLDGGTRLRRAEIESVFGGTKQEWRREEMGVSAEREGIERSPKEISRCS